MSETGAATKRTSLRGETQRRRILEAAAALFAENGYHGTGIEEISQAVGLGRGALYHHMGNKESVLYEICSTNVAEMLAVGRQIAADDASAEERLRRLLTELLKHIARNRNGWSVFFRDYIALVGPQFEKIVELREEFEQVLADLIAEGVESGELRSTDPVIVKGVLGIFNYSYLWISEKGRLKPEEIALIYCDTIFEGLRAPAE